MRVLLLNPPLLTDPYTDDLVVNAPLSACLLTGYAGACLKQAGLDVAVMDADLAGLDVEATREQLLAEDFDLLGVHLKFLWGRTAEIMTMLQEIKREKPHIHLNLYGHYPTFAWEPLLRQLPFVDSVVLGEPELTLTDLARRLAGLDKGFWQDTVGLAVNGEGGPVQNSPRCAIADLDALPFPLRPSPELAARRNMHNYILGSRGCFGRCTFCYLNSFYGPGTVWRGRSPENIVAEIDEVYRATGNPSFYFADANFFGPGERGRQRALELARLLKQRDFPLVFGLECRSSDVDEEVFAGLVEAGLRDVFLGVESGAQSALDRFQKGTTVAQNERAITILRRLGLNISLGFINFDPGTTLEEIRENLDFLQRMELLDCPSTTAHLFFHRQVVLRGTPAYNQLLARGQLRPVGFTAHEGEYTIVDPRAEAVARVMGRVCRLVLEITGGEDLYTARGPKVSCCGRVGDEGRSGLGEGLTAGGGNRSIPAHVQRQEIFRRLNLFLQDFLSRLLDAAGRGELNLGTVAGFVAAGHTEIEEIMRNS
ncbi:B12-binding domain-containing radical SAM protein [Desulfofundulus salinus]|uniref:Radical SAM protein n=1 Tax=Desulfofundulus salinus TaxID=2419843 RepID=A0A494WW91_9FIRM|nr:radical SAM protein [Desulfofundulus salinum]RKO67769.1 radical SAM protein [Desulfofundulus salinum]